MTAATVELDDDTADHATTPSADRVVLVITAVAVVVFWLITTSWRPWDLFDRAGFQRNAL